MDNDHWGEQYREGYPEKLAAAEKRLMNLSRHGRGKEAASGISGCTGIGLSGGGIRSATFCLGVFQGLARLKLLKNLDFLSTVSGGGYFGSFYARFFLRSQVPDFPFVEDTLARCPESGARKSAYQRNILTWLRENGRYLSPRGSGDLLLLGAVLLRNWMVVHIVLALLVLLLFLTGHLLRIPLDPLLQQKDLLLELPWQLKVWVSSFWVLPVLLFLFWAVPFGWAYWMVGRQPRKLWMRPIAGLVAVVVLALCAPLVFPDSATCYALAAGVVAISLLTALCSFVADSKRVSGRVPPVGGTPSDVRYKDEAARHWVSGQLKGALVATLAALALVFVDSLGQTVYLVTLTPDATLKSWAGGVLGGLVALVPFATRIMISSGGANGRGRPKVLTKIVAAVAAFLVVTTILIALSVGSNAIAWGGKRPQGAPTGIGKGSPATLMQAEILHDHDEPNQWRIKGDPRAGDAGQEAVSRDRRLLLAAWTVTLLLSFLFGQSWPFLNRSTHQPLYWARLTRAYLGASNPRRQEEKGHDVEGGAVTRVIKEDDIDIESYWPWPTRSGKADMAEREWEAFHKGTPLHLVNVTVNETLDGRSQVQQQDRKGIGMAFGPAGVSAGIRHHAVFDNTEGTLDVFPKQGFRMFAYRDQGRAGEHFTGERLPLGQLMSISGAAFSTGIGARTNLALSLLAGVANVRLGYWWNSGIPPCNRERRQRRLLSQRLGGIFTTMFPVQSYLLDEYTARYHGTARRHWYLSDGGHFENMAGYELIRRRLRLIVIVDAEADPDYNFEGLANLIRKARIDFGAEITFLDDSQLSRLFPDPGSHPFSTLPNLRRGKWVEENTPSVTEPKRQTIDPVDHRCYSLAHAALARVTYDCSDKAESCLVYLKPTIVGDEPVDVLQYHAENSAFPQETTVDQFFDEAQWESYRSLGEHIALEVFKSAGDDEQWWETLVEKVLSEASCG